MRESRLQVDDFVGWGRVEMFRRSSCVVPERRDGRLNSGVDGTEEEKMNVAKKKKGNQ